MGVPLINLEHLVRSSLRAKDQEAASGEIMRVIMESIGANETSNVDFSEQTIQLSWCQLRDLTLGSVSS